MDFQKKVNQLQARLQKINNRILEAVNSYYFDRQEIEQEYKELQSELAKEKDEKEKNEEKQEAKK